MDALISAIVNEDGTARMTALCVVVAVAGALSFAIAFRVFRGMRRRRLRVAALASAMAASLVAVGLANVVLLAPRIMGAPDGIEGGATAAVYPSSGVVQPYVRHVSEAWDCRTYRDEFLRIASGSPYSVATHQDAATNWQKAVAAGCVAK